jgi:hypothetical protein
MYTRPIQDVLRALNSRRRKVFCTKREVEAVIHTVSFGFCRLVPFDREEHRHQLLEQQGWSTTGSGIELTEHGKEAVRQLLSPRLRTRKQIVPRAA